MAAVDFVTNPHSGGGPRNIYTLSRLLNENGYKSSLIFFNELSSQKKSDLILQQFHVHAKMPAGLLKILNQALNMFDDVTFLKLPFFYFQEYIIRVMTLKKYSDVDAFISTFWQTVTPTSRVAKELGKPHFYFVQADETRFSGDKVYKRLAQKSYQLNIPRFTHSKWVKEFLDSNYGGDNTNIGMGLDHEAFKPRKLEKEEVVFTIARSGKNKGFDIFVKAMNILFDKHPDIKIKIAGEGRIVQEMKNSGAIRFPFEFLGWVRDDGVLSQLYEKSIFINTGNFEALPMPPLEAMACGSSVVMTDMPGAEEFARNGQNCLLSKPGDFNSFSENVAELLESDSLRSMISKNAEQTAGKYTWDKTIQNFTGFLGEHGLVAK